MRTQSGLAGINVRVAQCYSAATQTRSVNEMEYCWVLDLMACRLANQLHLPTSATKNSFNVTLDRLLHAAPEIGADAEKIGGELLPPWIETTNLAEKYLGDIVENRAR